MQMSEKCRMRVADVMRDMMSAVGQLLERDGCDWSGEIVGDIWSLMLGEAMRLGGHDEVRIYRETMMTIRVMALLELQRREVMIKQDSQLQYPKTDVAHDWWRLLMFIKDWTIWYPSLSPLMEMPEPGGGPAGEELPVEVGGWVDASTLQATTDATGE
jgi:hypothetical protein